MSEENKMSEENLKLMSIAEIIEGEYNFFIPSYQRGYRWTQQEVKDLLIDIDDFKPNSNDAFYCIQPLVVKQPKDKEYYEVIDGQQRLTTIFILLKYLNSQIKCLNSYSLVYETRIGSKKFLEEINAKTKDENLNIDFYHMWQAYNTIKKWFEESPDECKRCKCEFKEKLLNHVKFIWYQASTEENAIEIFTRLNIGKIPLTNAELIKALFLNRSNFKDADTNSIRLFQQEIASEWDTIEYTLQNDEFWLFLHPLGWKNPTHIDFIFDLIRENDLLKLFKENDEELKTKIGTDNHCSFRYFYEYFKKYKSEINKNEAPYRLRDDIWKTVKRYFQIFQEWYNDLEMYHYVGFLIETGTDIKSLIKIWEQKDEKGDPNESNKKDYFITKLKEKIKEKNYTLTQEYEIPRHPKTQCRPILLLFNIQTVINQNKALANSSKYKSHAFYKFPFHLFKKEGKKANGKGWEIEHIASNAGDDFESLEKQKIYLASIKYALSSNPLRKKIDDFLKEEEPTQFNVLYKECEEHLFEEKPLPDKYKNYIWNYALLDSTTNEEYQNAPFPIKRICVLAKENGKKATIELNKENNEINVDDEKEEGIAFIPPCTRSVFTKAYSRIPKALNAWTLEDAKDYIQKMKTVLEDFIDKNDHTNLVNLIIDKEKETSSN